MAVLWLLCGEAVAAATVAASARREAMLWLHASQQRINTSAVPTAPESPSSISTHALLPWIKQTM